MIERELDLFIFETANGQGRTDSTSKPVSKININKNLDASESII